MKGSKWLGKGIFQVCVVEFWRKVLDSSNNDWRGVEKCVGGGDGRGDKKGETDSEPHGLTDFLREHWG
jgi:hypothetical protein